MKEKSKSISFENKKARFDYEILENYEAGIELNGYEIKAIRAHKINLTGSHARIMSGQVYWLGGIIGVPEGDQQRTRRLLLKRNEINKIFGKLSKEKLTLIPLKLYIVRGKAKLLLGLGRGKKQKDKRESLKQRDLERENARYTKIK